MITTATASFWRSARCACPRPRRSPLSPPPHSPSSAVAPPPPPPRPPPRPPQAALAPPSPPAPRLAGRYEGSPALGKFYIITDAHTHPYEQGYLYFWEELDKARNLRSISPHRALFLRESAARRHARAPPAGASHFRRPRPALAPPSWPALGHRGRRLRLAVGEGQAAHVRRHPSAHHRVADPLPRLPLTHSALVAHGPRVRAVATSPVDTWEAAARADGRAVPQQVADVAARVPVRPRRLPTAHQGPTDLPRSRRAATGGPRRGPGVWPRHDTDIWHRRVASA